MDAVREHGEPLVDDPGRVGAVAQLGVDETTWLAATKDHPTLFATGLVDLRRRVVIDVVPGNSATDLARWLDRQPPGWLARVRVVATDLAESYGAGLAGRLDHAIRVADPFHVVRVAHRCLDQVRRRVQTATLGAHGAELLEGMPHRDAARGVADPARAPKPFRSPFSAPVPGAPGGKVREERAPRDPACPR